MIENVFYVVGQLWIQFKNAILSTKLIVVGTTTQPLAIDPALRRPGRMDREVSVPAPNGVVGFEPYVHDCIHIYMLCMYICL